MKQYRIVETVCYETYIEANSEEEAAEIYSKGEYCHPHNQLECAKILCDAGDVEIEEDEDFEEGDE